MGKCLNKDPEERWQTVRDLISELRWILEDLANSGTSTGSKTHRKERQRGLRQKRTTRLIVIGATLALVAAGAFWFYFARSPSLPPMRVSRVTSYPGLETEPALSPDGKMVAFVWNGENQDNRDIYVKLVDEGVPFRLTKDPADDRSPTWSPDGRLVAFRRDSPNGGGIYLVPSLGGGERRLSSLVAGPSWEINAKALDWSPDGKFLASSERPTPEAGPRIVLIAIDTGEKKQLTSGPRDLYPSFSPDGESLLFCRVDVGARADLYRVRVSGGEPQRITYRHDGTVDSGKWTARGTEIIFTGDSFEGGLFRVGAYGGKPQPFSPGGQFGYHPSISRQGDRLVYSEQTYDTDIWQLDLSASHNGKPPSLNRLVSSSRREDMPQFAPDGKRIAFDSNRSGHWEIWVCDSDGRNPVQLTSFGSPFSRGTPRWSPDGAFIAFDAEMAGQSSIFVINVESRMQRNLTLAKNCDGAVPSWSRDGRWIYFDSNRGGSSQVWKMPVAGGEAIQVTKNGGFEAFESFDGSSIYYSKSTKPNEIWRVPTAGGEETRFLDSTLWRYWAVGEKGIYFIARENRFLVVNFIGFADERIIQLGRFERRPVKDVFAGLAVSPDGHSLLWTLPEGYNSDIMLVENFH